MLSLILTTITVFYANAFLTSASALYSSQDPIVQLATANFTDTIHAKDHIWYVEFYATWCGHCQRLADTWRTFANDVKEWSKVVRVAAIACSDHENGPACRSHSILGYPTIRVFLPRSSAGTRGFDYKGEKTAEALRASVLQYASSVAKQGETPTTWPFLEQWRSVKEMWSRLQSSSADFVFLVAEKPGRHDENLGKEVILDLSNKDHLFTVARIAEQEAELLGIGEYPSAHVLWTDGVTQRLSLATDRHTMARDIEDYYRRYTGQEDTATTPSFVTKMSSVTNSPTIDYIPSARVHLDDLESALYYALWNEVAGRNIIDGDAMKTLQQHLTTLSKYLPAHPRVQKFLKKLSTWLNGKKRQTGTQFLAQLNRLQEPNKNSWISNDTTWNECKGSASRYRGYPCGLWMTFHALTVNAVEQEWNNPEFDPRDILFGIRSYVKHFFGCRHCAEHFLENSNHIDEEVRGRQDGVLWLWRFHNNVNRRLRGDSTEDPHHPKIQFPAEVKCPSCRTEESPKGYLEVEGVAWVEAEVIRYLIAFYGKDSIIEVTEPRVQTTTPKPVPIAAMSRNCEPQDQAPCPPQVTDWSPCSQTCGAGTSVRMTNENIRCQMEMQFRLCYIRPCSDRPGTEAHRMQPLGAVARGGCTSSYTHSDPEPFVLRFGGCRTRRPLVPTYCGVCRGKCCSPVATRTEWEDIICERNYSGQALVMKIDRCQCLPGNCSVQTHSISIG